MAMTLRLSDDGSVSDCLPRPSLVGDKRLGWLATVAFYGRNEIDLDAPDSDAYDLVMTIASEHRPVEEITQSFGLLAPLSPRAGPGLLDCGWRVDQFHYVSSPLQQVKSF